MKGNRWSIGLLIGAILLVAGYALYGMRTTGLTRRAYHVSVVLDDSSSERWTAFREGLNQGAEEFGILVDVVSTGRLSGAGEEASYLEREISGGADGVIFQPCASDEEGVLSDALGEKPFVLVGGELEPGALMDVVQPNPEKMGKAVGAALVQDKAVRRVGVLTGNDLPSVKMRQESFLAEVEAAGVTAAWVSTTQETDQEALEELLFREPVDALVTLDNASTELALDVLSGQEEPGCRLYGVGRSARGIYYLDRGLITALVVPDEFDVGYQAMRLLWERMDYSRTAYTHREVPFVTVTGKNIYEDDMAGILFPTVS